MKVSIIIPMFNSAPYIERCLYSIVSQNYYDLEVIVVDDASTDASVAIVEKLVSLHHNVRLMRHSTNQGPMVSRSEGCEAATGDFIMFVDADDALPGDAVSNLVDIERETAADIVAGSIEKRYIDGRKEYIVSELIPNATPADAIVALLTEKLKHSLCGKLYKASLFRYHNFLSFDNMTISEDGCMFYQLAKVARQIVTRDEIVYYYYENLSSSSQRVYGIRQVESIIVANEIIYNICKEYTAIDAKLQYKMSRNLFTLYAECVPNGEVRRLLAEHGLARYGQVGYVIHYLHASDFWFFVKRFIRVRLLALTARGKNNSD